MADSQSTRRPLSVRTRFEVFKRDEFTCRYCGNRSPHVVLEIDHVVPVCDGGSDDSMNLVTSCWECNRGKGGVTLVEVIAGEDPHDKAVHILERERQLHEYNALLAEVRARREDQAQELVDYWCQQTGKDGVWKPDFIWLQRELDTVPAEMIRNAMIVAISRGATKGLRYVAACLRNWKERGEI